MADPAVADQELVVHCFALAEGREADRAYERLATVWQRCGEVLGLTRAIAGVNLPRDLPTRPGPPPPGPLAARENLTADCQAIVRREHDILNLSVVFACPSDDGRNGSAQLRIGSAAPPGWIEFDRWWNQVVEDVSDHLIGVVRIYQAKVTGLEVGEIPGTVRSQLPAMRQHDQWWDRVLLGSPGFAHGLASGLGIAELSAPDDGRIERRILVLAPADEDARLSAWTWSRGDPALPPLGRYLLHAAKLRYELRQWNAAASAVRDVAARAFEDNATVAELALTMSWTRSLTHAVDIAASNMATILGEPVPMGAHLFSDDATLATWFATVLDDAMTDLTIARETLARETIARETLARETLARETATELRAPARPLAVPPDAGPSRAAGPPRETRNAIQVGFVLDAVGYSSRPEAAKRDVQRRVAELVGDVLRGLRLTIADTDHHGTGDGMVVFLPAGVEVQVALPHLLNQAVELLARDNERYTDRLRVRLSAVVGPISPAAIGFGGRTVVEAGRLVDSPPARTALERNPDADLAAIVSDTLYTFTVRDGCPGLASGDFTQVDVRVKETVTTAWLWLPPRRS